MSSQFLTFIFIILVSVQLSSCGWGFPWKIDQKEESSTESTTEKSFKDDEPSSPPPIEDDDSKLPLPKDPNVLSIDNNEDESLSESSAQSTKTTLENVSAIPNEEFDEYPEEESSKFANSEMEIKSIPTTSTNFTNKIVSYVSSTATKITDSSTPTTEKSESKSSTDNTNTPTTTENTLNDNDDVDNVPRNADEDKEDSKGSSSVSASSSTIPSSLENSNFEIESVSNSSEFFRPEVTYAPNDKYINSSNDEEKEPLADNQPIGRKDKETHSSRYVTDEPDYSTQIITTENYESGDSTTDMTKTPLTTENALNYTSNNEARNVINGIESYDNDKKRGALVGSGSTGSFFVNFTLNVCVFLGDLLFFNSSFT